jgi:hypothetical protein
MNEVTAQSSKPKSIPFYDESEWAYNNLIKDGTSTLWNPRSRGVTALADITRAKDDFGALPSLPRAPKGFTKEDRTLEEAMMKVYKVIVYK